RMGGETPKQYRLLAGKPVLRWAVEALIRHPMISAVRVVIGKGQQEQAARALGSLAVGDLIEGGAERADSVRAGLNAVQTDAVLVHDAARPFCPSAVIDRLLARLEFSEGAAPVLPVGDTLARTAETLGDAVDRSGLVRVQTPQAFRLGAVKDAYERREGTSPTGEAAGDRAAGIDVDAGRGD